MARKGNRSQRLDAKALRAEFPVTRHCTCLNHAAVSPLPNPVRAAMSKFIADQGVMRI